MIWEKPYFKYLFFPIVSLLFFYPTYKYGYVTDFLSWLYKYEYGNWSDLKDCFDYPGLHHFFHLVNFSVFKIVGKSFLGWYVVLSILHGINGALIHHWIERMTLSFKIKNGLFLKWFVPLIFMLSPYAVEPVVWKACLHYLLSLGLIVGGLIYLTDYLQTLKKVWRIHICFLLALLTLEISLAVPFIYLIYWISYELYSKKGLWKKCFIAITIPQLGIIVAYFLANKYFLGGWVGHYGEENHLNFDLELMSGTAFQYLGKYSLFLHYLPFKLKMPIYESINSLYGILVMILLSAAMIIYLLRKSFRQKLDNSILIAFSYLGFFMALFPIANLFFFKVQIYENDRYGYLASLFFYLFVGLVINKLSGISRWIAAALFASLILLTGVKTIIMANKAGTVTHALVDDFDFYDHDEIVFLAKPDNLGGMQLFRDLSGQARSFTESLYHFNGKNYEGKMSDLAQVNILGLEDKIKVSIIDSTTLHVKNPQAGSWFWKDGMGLPNYETEDYKVTKHGWYYELKRKVTTDDKLYLVFDGLEWVVVDWY